jgi:hypothetical protein
MPDKYVKPLHKTREQIWQDSKTIKHDFFRMIVRLIQWRQLRDAMIPYLGRCENKYVPEVMCELHCKDLWYWTCYERGTTVEEDDEFKEEGVTMELREVASWIVKTVNECLVSVGLWNNNKLTVEVDFFDTRYTDTQYTNKRRKPGSDFPTSPTRGYAFFALSKPPFYDPTTMVKNRSTTPPNNPFQAYKCMDNKGFYMKTTP